MARRGPIRRLVPRFLGEHTSLQLRSETAVRDTGNAVVHQLHVVDVAFST
jgi:hypothetical protein